MVEKEINMLELLANFLLKWRKIVLFLLVGVLLGGAWGYVSSIDSNKKQAEKVEWAKEELAKYNSQIEEGQTVDAAEVEKVQEIINRGVVLLPAISVKHIILFALFCVFAYAFFFLISYVRNEKICVTDELEEIFGIAQLGLITKDQKVSKLTGKIDGAILRLRDGEKKKPTEVRALQLAYVSVGLIAEKNELDTVYFVGCDIKGHTAYVCEQLKNALAKKDIRVEVLSNVLYNPEVMSKLEIAQGVILVEKAGSTKYKEIQREIELMDRLNIRVWGGIIVQ